MKYGDATKRVSTVSVSATNQFIASDHIQSANIGWMNDNFEHLFLNKVEENVPAAELKISRLIKASPDALVMTELGEKKKIALAHFFQLLEKQANGQSGPLLINGYANIAYVPDEEGNFWAVSAYWFSYYRYWNVHANSVDCPDEWDEGSQVLSQVS